MVFGKRSIERKKTCHRDLQLILDHAIETSLVDFGISEGKRTDAKQLEYFLAGKSRIDPRNPELKRKGKHLRSPSWAVDIYAYVPGRKDLAFDRVHLAYLAGHIMNVAKTLYDDEIINHRLRWGGNWDSDGTLLYDQSLQDMTHFELI